MRGTLKCQREPHGNCQDFYILCVEKEALLGIQRERINLLKNIHKVGKAICCPNDVANVRQATDELNISPI